MSLGTTLGRVVWMQGGRNEPIRVDWHWDGRWVLSFIYKTDTRCSVDQQLQKDFSTNQIFTRREDMSHWLQPWTSEFLFLLPSPLQTALWTPALLCRGRARPAKVAN